MFNDGDYRRREQSSALRLALPVLAVIRRTRRAKLGKVSNHQVPARAICTVSAALRATVDHRYIPGVWAFRAVLVRQLRVFLIIYILTLVFSHQYR